MPKDFITNGECIALPARKLTQETCEKFGYKVGTVRGEKVQIIDIRVDGKITGQKVRTKDKQFYTIGDVKGAGLTGLHLWRDAGKKIVITEGEHDMMALSQVQGNKWPVVSIPFGTDSARKAIAVDIEKLEAYEEVILMFDMDKSGREAVEECVTLFKPGKCKVASLPLKDASDMLVAGRSSELIDAIWSAQTMRPEGIVTLKDLKKDVLKPIEEGLPWWSEKLTELTYGRRYGEIYCLGAGTGSGKTDFLTQQIEYDIVELNEPVGVFFFEQQPIETAKRICGKAAGKQFHIPGDSWTSEELMSAFEDIEDSPLYLFDHFGTAEWEVVERRIRFLRHANGVRIFYIDHLTALAAEKDDERKALENIMASMGGLVKELDIIIVLVSHLATPEGKSHEEGGRVMIRHFKGSRAIGFWCHYMFGIERDQQLEDESKRHISTFRILKDRYTGRATGKSIYLGYDHVTGVLNEQEESPFKDETGGQDEGEF